MVRLVAVAVDDDDVAGRAKSLHDNLVGGRGAVGGEVAPLGAEGSCGELLHRLDVACRLQQAVEAAGGRGRLGQEDVGAVKLAHVADPLGVEHGLAAGDGQGVERPDRPLAVIEQIREIWRAVAVVDAVHDAEMDLQRLLDAEEDAPNGGRLFARREGFHRPVGDQVDVELRPEVLDHGRQARSEAPALGPATGLIKVGIPREVIMQQRRVATGREREAVVDHDGLDAVVQHGRDGGVLEAADDDHVVSERVLPAPQSHQLAAGVVPVLRIIGGDDQDVEARFRKAAAVGVRRKGVPRPGLRFLQRIPGGGIVPVRIGEERAADLAREPREGAGVMRIKAFLQQTHEVRTRVRPVVLERRELFEHPEDHLVRPGPTVIRRGPGGRRRVELAPSVAACVASGEERIDRLERGFGCDGRFDLHGAPPRCRGRRTSCKEVSTP